MSINVYYCYNINVNKDSLSIIFSYNILEPTLTMRFNETITGLSVL